MRRILSEVLRRKDGVERRNRRAGALRIEFIERSRDESLGIEWFFAAYGAVCGGKTGQLEDGVAACSVKTTGAYGGGRILGSYPEARARKPARAFASLRGHDHPREQGTQSGKAGSSEPAAKWQPRSRDDLLDTTAASPPRDLQGNLPLP